MRAPAGSHGASREGPLRLVDDSLLSPEECRLLPMTFNINDAHAYVGRVALAFGGCRALDFRRQRRVHLFARAVSSSSSDVKRPGLARHLVD